MSKKTSVKGAAVGKLLGKNVVGKAFSEGIDVATRAVNEGLDVALRAANEGVDAASRLANMKIDEIAASVEVPDICKPGHPLKLDEVRAWLEERELKCIQVIAKPNAEFAEYSDLDVVGSSHKAKQKVKPSERITVYYVTLDVIEESKKLLNEAEKTKEEVTKQKDARREETKQRLVGFGVGVKDRLGSATDKAGKGLSGLASKIGKKGKEGKEDNETESEE